MLSQSFPAHKSHVTLRVSSTLDALGCGGYGSISLPRLAATLRDGVKTKYHPAGENHLHPYALHTQTKKGLALPIPFADIYARISVLLG